MRLELLQLAYRLAGLRVHERLGLLRGTRILCGRVWGYFGGSGLFALLGRFALIGALQRLASRLHHLWGQKERYAQERGHDHAVAGATVEIEGLALGLDQQVRMENVLFEGVDHQLVDHGVDSLEQVAQQIVRQGPRQGDFADRHGEGLALKVTDRNGDYAVFRALEQNQVLLRQAQTLLRVWIGVHVENVHRDQMTVFVFHCWRILV